MLAPNDATIDTWFMLVMKGQPNEAIPLLKKQLISETAIPAALMCWQQLTLALAAAPMLYPSLLN
jgi:hypothetical protein